MVVKAKALKELEEAIESISTGLLLLEHQSSFLEALGGSKAVDIAARLNTQYNALEKHLTPLKSHLKAEAIEAGVDSLPGDNYQANLKKINKTYLLTDKIKKFLGKKLPDYQEVREEAQLSFGVKE